MSKTKKLISEIKFRIPRPFTRFKKHKIWKSADVYVISYPRAGRTWLNTFVAKYLSLAFNYPLKVNVSQLKNIDVRLPNIMFAHYGYFDQVVRHVNRGAFPYDPKTLLKNIHELSGRSVVFIVRDPRDVVVSHYFYLKRRGNLEVEELTLSEFLRHPDFGIHWVVEYMNLWYENRNCFGDFSMFRYKDFLASPEHFFRKFLQALGVGSINESLFQETLGFTSFENMRALEKKNVLKGAHVKAAGVGKNKDLFHMRRGKVEGYRRYFSGSDIQYANKAVEKLNPDFGYTADY